MVGFQGTATAGVLGRDSVGSGSNSGGRSGGNAGLVVARLYGPVVTRMDQDAAAAVVEQCRVQYQQTRLTL